MTHGSEQPTVPAQLLETRHELDRLDRDLVELVARRRAQVRRLWAWKDACGLPLRDAEREAGLLARAEELGAKLGLGRSATRTLMLAVLAAMHDDGTTPDDDRGRDTT
ncbi:MAG: chorismate mutase [Deltaproteobacteria bacterium]|nr:chorismate mutase [Deltaproteobacteria bacterium]